MSHNPLNRYFRVPKCYVKLPSDGKFYPEDFIETAASGEIAVYPLSAIDQILLKTPDAVLNGEALLKVVKNCVPGVSDVKKLVEPDINSIMVAIRIATHGNTTEFNITCPKCSTEHAYDVDLQNILQSQEMITDDPVIDFHGELRIYIRPYDFEQRNLQILNEIEEQQTLKLINSNTEIDENLKIAQLSAHIDKMSNRTFDVVSLSIQAIEILATKETVTDRAFISEFLKGISKDQADIIIDAIRELNQKGINTKHRFSCISCGYSWDQQLDFDPTSFFD